MERFLAQTWVLVTAFIVGPALLFWMYRRRWHLEKEAQEAASGAPREAAPPRTPKRSATAEKPVAVSKPLWPGYRGIRWGQPPVEGMTMLHEDGDTRYLVRSSDELLIGNVHISSAVYSFRLGQLEAVVIELPLQGLEPLVRHLTSEWGKPRSATDRSRHVWSDSGSGPDASQAVLEKHPENRTARLVLSSRAAHAERAKTRVSD